MKKILITLSLFIAFYSSSYANMAIKLLEENIEARGGIEKLKSIEVIEFAIVTKSEQMPVPDTSRNLYSGDKYRISSTGTNTVVFDNGKEGYVLSPMFGADTLTKMNDQQRAQMKNQFKQIKGFLLGYVFKMYQKKEQFNIEYLGKEKIGNEDVKKIKISSPQSVLVTNLFLGKNDKMTKKIEIVTPQNTLEFTLSNYKKVDGVLFPHKIRMTNPMMNIDQYIADLKFNHKVPDKLFNEL